MNVVLKLCNVARPPPWSFVLLVRNWEVGGRYIDRVASLPQVKGNLASCREGERKRKKERKHGISLTLKMFYIYFTVVVRKDKTPSH